MTDNKGPPSPSIKTIVWFSRHLPTRSQLQALAALYPHHRLLLDTNAFSDATDVVRRFEERGGDEMVVVAPLTVIRELVKRGLKPLRAQMEQCAPTDAEVHEGGRHYRFVRFTRITAIEVTEVQP
jgi:hypothetical protein